MRTSCARTSAGRAVTMKTAASVRANILLLNPAQHRSRGPGSFCPRDAMHANHKENLGIGGGHEGNHKSVSGTLPRVSARRRTGLDQGVGAAECAIDFLTGTVLGRLFHSRHDLANAGLG